MNLRENYKKLKLEACAGMQKRPDSKHWIWMLEATPFFLGSLTRGRLLLVVNSGMRILDDITDGDRQPPPGFSPITYLEEKQAFIQNPQKPEDKVDYLFLYCYQLADKAGLKINYELNAFFEYFLFDAKRRGTRKIFTRAELDHAYDACDITGTIRGSLMIFGDDPERVHLLMPLGRAVRKYYTLRDYEADIAAGLVNIPKKSFEMHKITEEDLLDRFSPSVRAWFHEEASAGLKLLEQHQEIMHREKFSLRGRLALSLAYTKATTAYLKSVLEDQK